MPDVLSILRHPNRVLAKTWLADGAIGPYERAMRFSFATYTVTDIRSLSRFLTRLESDPRACLIRGAYDEAEARRDPEFKIGTVLRRIGAFKDQPLHSIMIEVDDFEPLLADAVDDPEACAKEYITSVLPKEFHGVSFHWQLSNSAGHPTKRGIFKAHLWFWLEEAATSDQVRAWADAINLDCDHSVMNPVQIHYTSKPLFEEGVKDPIARRSGFVEGFFISPERKELVNNDAVKINIAAMPIVQKKLRQRGEFNDAAIDDPTALFLEKSGLVIGKGKEGQLHIKCPFEDGHSTPRKSIDETSYFPRGTGGYEKGHFVCFHDTCKRGHPDEHFIEALGVYEDEFDDIDDNLPAVKGETKLERLPPMNRNQKGQLEADLPNLGVVFDRPDFFGYQTRYDAFTDETMVTAYGKEEWQALKDAHAVEMRRELQRRYKFRPIGRELMRDALIDAAERHTFDSAIHWIENLVPAWDGVERIDGFLACYFGAEDNTYTRAVSRYLWTALAGRVLEPGIKADMVPVLVGAQGVGKSTGVAAISPSPSFYTEIDLMTRDDDQSRKMRGKLIGEIGELRGLNSRDGESIKAFLSRTHEEWVPKFQERKTIFPRRLVFVGTTNDEDFLSDTTGNRRWLPVKVGGANVPAIREDRLQLWAEARDLFTVGGVDWTAEKLAAPAHAAHRAVDPWEYVVSDWLKAKDEYDDTTPEEKGVMTVKEIARQALNIEPKGMTNGMTRRVAAILNNLGWRRDETISRETWKKVA